MTQASRQEALAALGLSERATWDNYLKEIEKRVELSDLKPDTLDVLTSSVESELRQKFTHSDALLLAPDALERAKAAERDAWIKRAREHHQIADRALVALREETDAAITRSRMLTPEAAEPAASRQEALLARLLDVSEEAAAEAWIARHAGPAVLARYQATTDDGPGRTFARVVEQRQREGTLMLGTGDDMLALSKAIGETIRTRQDARVNPGLRKQRERIDLLAADLDRSALQLNATVDTVARALRSAGRPGVLARPVRQTTPDTARA